MIYEKGVDKIMNEIKTIKEEPNQMRQKVKTDTLCKHFRKFSNSIF